METKSSCVLDGGVQAYISSPAEETVGSKLKSRRMAEDENDV